MTTSYIKRWPALALSSDSNILYILVVPNTLLEDTKNL